MCMIYAHVNAYVDVYLYANVCICTYVCLCICMYMQMYMYTHWYKLSLCDIFPPQATYFNYYAPTKTCSVEAREVGSMESRL